MLPGQDEVAHDYEVGTAYPGQQHWVRVEGAALRSAYHWETVTFHDADRGRHRIRRGTPGLEPP